MSQPDTHKATAAQERSRETESFVRTVKTATRRKYTPEEKIRSVGNQQEWDTLGPERSWVGWRSRELPEGPVVPSSRSFGPSPPSCAAGSPSAFPGERLTASRCPSALW